MQKVLQKKWDAFKQAFYEKLDGRTSEDFEEQLDVLYKKMREKIYSLDEVRNALTYRTGNGDGYTVGHTICRRHFLTLAIRMRAQHERLWHDWMNCTTGFGHTPPNYTPLMCLMSKKFPWESATVSDQRDWSDFIFAVMRPMSFDMIANEATNAGTFVNIAAGIGNDGLLDLALSHLWARQFRQEDIVHLVNQQNGKKQTAWDVSWNNKLVRKVLAKHGGKASAKGKGGSRGSAAGPGWQVQGYNPTWERSIWRQ